MWESTRRVRGPSGRNCATPRGASMACGITSRLRWAWQNAEWAAPADDSLSGGWVDAGLDIGGGGDWLSTGDWAV